MSITGLTPVARTLILTHPGHDLERGFDAHEPRPASRRLRERVPVGSLYIDRLSLSRGATGIKPALTRANMIAAVSARSQMGA